MFTKTNPIHIVHHILSTADRPAPGLLPFARKCEDRCIFPVANILVAHVSQGCAIRLTLGFYVEKQQLMPLFFQSFLLQQSITDISLVIRQSGSRLCWRATCQEQPDPTGMVQRLKLNASTFFCVHSKRPMPPKNSSYETLSYKTCFYQQYKVCISVSIFYEWAVADC